jgi:hypothetical protein
MDPARPLACVAGEGGEIVARVDVSAMRIAQLVLSAGLPSSLGTFPAPAGMSLT